MSKMIELMDQWLGIKNIEPHETVGDFPTENGTRPESSLKPAVIQVETVKTFWDEHLKKPEIKLPRPEKKEKVPITSRIKSMYQIIKEEREAEVINRQHVERIPIDWKKVKEERKNEKYTRKYNGVQNAVHNL